MLILWLSECYWLAISQPEIIIESESVNIGHLVQIYIIGPNSLSQMLSKISNTPRGQGFGMSEWLPKTTTSRKQNITAAWIALVRGAAVDLKTAVDNNTNEGWSDQCRCENHVQLVFPVLAKLHQGLLQSPTCLASVSVYSVAIFHTPEFMPVRFRLAKTIYSTKNSMIQKVWF